MEDFIFPASKLIVEARNGSGKENILIYFCYFKTKMKAQFNNCLSKSRHQFVPIILVLKHNVASLNR